MSQVSEDLLTEVKRRLTLQFQEADTARRVSVDDAIEAEGAMQSRYSTFKEESQYLAGGQMKRSLEIKDAIAAVNSLLINPIKTGDQITLGSLVTIKCANLEECRRYLIVPELAGGFVLNHQVIEGEITTTSSQSPLGKILLKKEVGDQVLIPSGKNHWEITDIA